MAELSILCTCCGRDKPPTNGHFGLAFWTSAFFRSAALPFPFTASLLVPLSMLLFLSGLLSCFMPAVLSFFILLLNCNHKSRLQNASWKVLKTFWAAARGTNGPRPVHLLRWSERTRALSEHDDYSSLLSKRVETAVALFSLCVHRVASCSFLTMISRGKQMTEPY